MSIPSHYKRFVSKRILESEEEMLKKDDWFMLEEVPLPPLPFGTLLIRVEHAPINPSDLLHLLGKHGQVDPPFGVGYEGAGTVVGSGGGPTTWGKMGKKVAFVSQSQPHSYSWAEYAIVPAILTVELPRGVGTDIGACSFVNPLCAVCFIEEAQYLKQKVILHTAAASALGKILLRLAKPAGIEVICVVRKESQAEVCRKEGAKTILNSTDEDFAEKLRKICEEKQCTLCYEAVGGPLTGIIVNAMPDGSTVKVYGALSYERVSSIDPVQLIFHRKVVTGFASSVYLDTKYLVGKIQTMNKVSAEIGKSSRVDLGEKFRLPEVQKAIAHYTSNMGAGKVLIQPNLPTESSSL